MTDRTDHPTGNGQAGASRPRDASRRPAPTPDSPPDPSLERDAQLPPTLWELVRRWGKRITITAFVLSILLHVGGLFISMLVRWGDGAIGGARAGEVREVEMAIASESELAELEALALSDQAPAIAETSRSDAPTPSIEDAASQSDVLSPAGLPEMGDLAGGGDVSLSGGQTGGGSGSGASFFGVEASGNRFAFIVDFSGSMAGVRMQRLMRELAKSLQGLAPDAEFVIVAFSDNARVIGGGGGSGPEWTQASRAGVARTIRTLDSMGDPSAGGTFVNTAIRTVMQMRPRPDAVYLMTDGEFQDDMKPSTLVAATLAQLGTRFPFHCVGFGAQAGAAELQQIAATTSGTYTFVEVE